MLFPVCWTVQGLKNIINEKFGDGIMSAIDFYVTVDKVGSLSYIEETPSTARTGDVACCWLVIVAVVRNRMHY